MLKFLDGKKTHATGGAMIAFGLLAFVNPELGAALGIGDPGQLIMEGLGLIFVRVGIAKVAAP